MRKFGLITALAAGVALTATSAIAQTTIKYSNDWKWKARCPHADGARQRLHSEVD